MRRAILLLAVVSLSLAGCGGKVEKELKTPGPPPPYNPEGARLDPKFKKDKPADTAPAESPTR
jgi:hypothetical protein